MTHASKQQPDDPSQLSQQDEHDLAAIHSSIDRMRAFLPTDPYILTIPQDEPRYHHSYHYQTKQWLEHTPFNAREHESIQYQTFHYHEPTRDIYMLQNSRPINAHVNIDAVKDRGGTTTGANTPSGNPSAGALPKKTISLKAYKQKLTNATPDHHEVVGTAENEQQGKKAAMKGPMERIKADEEVLAAVENGPDVLHASPVKEEKTDLKRKRDDSFMRDDTRAEQGKLDVHAEEPEPPKKAARTSSPRREEKREAQQPAPTPTTASTQSTAPGKLSPPRQSAHSNLPPRLSPPPAAARKGAVPVGKLSPTDTPYLPSRLGPTLPSNVSVTQSARAHHRSISRSSEVAGSRSASKDPTSRHLTPPPKSVPRNGFRANSGSPAVRSDAEDRGRAITSVPQRVKPDDEKAEESEEIVVSKKSEAARKRGDSTLEQTSLIVKLKCKERERLRGLLDKEPSPDKASAPEKHAENAIAVVDRGARRASRTAADARQRDRRDANAKGVARKVGPAAAIEKDGDDISITEARGGRRASRTSDAHQREQRDANTKGVATKVGSAINTNGTRNGEDNKHISSIKRKRSVPDEADDSDISRPERKKIASAPPVERNFQEPSTPAPPSDLLLSPSSAQKTSAAAQLTPKTMRKDALSAAMKREQSNDSRANNTPPPLTSQPSPSTNPHQPSTGNAAAAAAATKAPPQLPKTPKQEAWEAEHKRFDGIGRERKRAASSYLTSTSQATTNRETAQKRAALSALESFLAYMLAFTCADRASLAASPSRARGTRPWRSLQPFLGFVRNHCEPFPLLIGLACHLAVVVNGHVLELATQKPGELGVEQLLETAAYLRRAANEAEGKLDLDALRASFPRTWEGRARGALPAADAADGEAEDVGKGFGGNYKLPLGVQSEPLRAVRAGVGMLREWVEKEGVEGGYEFKVRL